MTYARSLGPNVRLPFSKSLHGQNLSMLGTLPQVALAADYGPKSLIRRASHRNTWLGPTHPVSGDDPTSKGYTYGRPT
jgi:hypothetical protein